MQLAYLEKSLFVSSLSCANIHYKNHKISLNVVDMNGYLLIASIILTKTINFTPIYKIYELNLRPLFPCFDLKVINLSFCSPTNHFQPAANSILRKIKHVIHIYYHTSCCSVVLGILLTIYFAHLLETE